MLRLTTAISCAFLLMTVGTSAHSAECSGNDFYKVELADTLDLGDGHSLTLFKSSAIIQNDDPKAVDHLIAGPCSGWVEVLPDGSFKMSGYCNRSNADGDSMVDHWWQDIGDEKGSWETVRGTGKLAAMVGGKGWFETVMENGALASGRWGGECP